MPFESEVIPLFIGGVYLVSLLELVIGCALLKGEKATRGCWIGHVVSMTIAMVFLIRCILEADWALMSRAHTEMRLHGTLSILACSVCAGQSVQGFF